MKFNEIYCRLYHHGLSYRSSDRKTSVIRGFAVLRARLPAQKRRQIAVTGAGGVLQSVLYGFGGIDWNHWDQMVKTPVCLPPTRKKLTITGVQHAGKRYTVTVTPARRTVTAE